MIRGMLNLNDTAERLKNQKISFYKIAQIIGEPESTIHNIFKGHCKYGEGKIHSILIKINNYLSELESSPETTVPVNPDLSLKLFKLGLDSKSFTPEEKLQLALAHKKLTESKNEKSIQDEEAA